MYDKIIEATEFIKSKIDKTPQIGIILGSGLQPLAKEIENPIIIEYKSVPNMTDVTAPGHVGQFVCGYLQDKYVICMHGRLHGYEGHSPEDIVFPVRVMKFLGIQSLILTNASGGINESFSVGDFMIICDHINMTGKSPLIGKNDDRIGTRFNDMTFAYSKNLQMLAKNSAQKAGIPIKEGVYMGVNGPQFETPAEIRAFRALGADAVGMSTVFEAIAAAHMNLPVLGISMITNMAAGVIMKELSGSDVNETAETKSSDFIRLIKYILKDF